MNYKIRTISAGEGDTSFDKVQFLRGRVTATSFIPISIVRYAYYAFVFSLPLEKADIEIGSFTLSRLLGFLLVAVTMAAVFLQKRRFRLRLPPKAFWFFAGYFVVYVVLGFNLIIDGREAVLTEQVIQGIKTLIQLLVFFWISYNLLQYERVRKGTLLTLAASVVIVAVLQSLGITDSITAQDRTAAFEANENLIADVLSLGLLIVVGLAYGRAKPDLKSRLLFWLFGGVLAVMIVVTGSRGAMIALLLALLVFFLHDKDLRVKLKVGSAVVLAVGLLGWLTYTIEPVRERWEKTYYEGDTAGREVIFGAAWAMFLEKPLTGWGPGYNISELGSRLGLRHDRDPHNMYLWLLTETGLLGAAFFLAGLWLCWHAAWKARSSIQGALPLSLMLFLLIIGVKGTIHTDKFFWVVLAYGVASATNASAVTRRSQTANLNSQLAKLRSLQDKH